MKKHLLLAAAGLIGCAASVMGQTSDSNYSVESPIKSLEDLKSGTYIIQGYAKDPSSYPHEGVLRSTTNTTAATVDVNTKEIPQTYDETILWKIEVTEAVDGKTPKTFTIQSVKEGYFWSFRGSSDKTINGNLYVNGSVIKTDGKYSGGNDYGNLKNGDDDKAQFTFAPNKWDLESSGAEPELKEGERFVVISTSVLRHANNGGNATSPGTPTLNLTTSGDVSWWNINEKDNGAEGTQAWLQFVPVKIEAKPVDATFTYPQFGDFAPSPVKASVIPGTENDVAKTYAPDFFEVAKVEKVEGSDDEYKVEGTWNFPFKLDCVGRFNIRSRLNYFTLVPNTSDGKKIATNREVSSTFDPANLFYLTSEGFNEKNRLKVTLRVIALDENWGLNCSTRDGSIGALSNEPTTWIVKTSTQGSNGFALQHFDGENAHINELTDRSDNPETKDNIGVWNNANSQNNDGSFIRFFELTEEDFNTKEWKNEEGDTVGLNSTLMEALRDNPTPANVRRVFDPNNTTTQLGEINAEGGNAGMVYDLQGRRLAAPVRGINIIDGKKVLLNR